MGPPAAGDLMPNSMGEVDPDVLAALPLEMQAEIRRSLKPSGSAGQHAAGPALHRFFGGQLAQGPKRKAAVSKPQSKTKRKQSK